MNLACVVPRSVDLIRDIRGQCFCYRTLSNVVGNTPTLNRQESSIAFSNHATVTCLLPIAEELYASKGSTVHLSNYLEDSTNDMVKSDELIKEKTVALHNPSEFDTFSRIDTTRLVRKRTSFSRTKEVHIRERSKHRNSRRVAGSHMMNCTNCLLSADEERVLTFMSQDFVYLQSLHSKLSETFGDSVDMEHLAAVLEQKPEEVYERYSIGAAAMNQVFEANLRLVMWVSKRFLKQGVSFEDLLTAGLLGLLTAIAKYDPSKGYKLSTYAHHWIKQYCQRAIQNQSRLVRLPVYLLNRFQKQQMTKHSLAAELGREPLLEELAKALQLSPERVTELSRSFSMTSSSCTLELEDPGKVALGDDSDSCVDELESLLFEADMALLSSGSRVWREAALKLKSRQRNSKHVRRKSALGLKKEDLVDPKNPLNEMAMALDLTSRSPMTAKRVRRVGS